VAGPSATSVVSLGKLGIMNAHEKPGTVRAHALFVFDDTDGKESVTIVLARGRCGSKPGRHLVLDKGYLPPEGANLALTVKTGKSKLVLPRMRSLRVLEKGEQIACGKTWSLKPATGNEVAIETIELVHEGLNATNPANGVAIGRDVGGRFKYTAIISPRDPASGLPTGKRTRSTATAAIWHQTLWEWRSAPSKPPIASFNCLPDVDDTVIVACTGSADKPVGRRARLLRVTGDGETIARGRVKHFTLG
jgi:hypothetical protein